MDSTMDDSTAWERRGWVPLGELAGHRMADDEPDVRGWDVVAPDGERIGRVAEVVVDRHSAEIAAVVVELTMRAAEGGSRVVLPIERVALLERRRALVAEDAVVSERAPSQVIDRDAPDVRTHAADAALSPAAPGGVLPTGVTVERSGDEEIVRVPIVEERLVVERRPVVTEVVTIRKRLVRGEDRVLEAELRKERIDVDRTGRTGD